VTRNIANRTAVVTGSSSGIGRAIAHRFGEEGANVVTNSRAQERAEETAAEIRQKGGTAVGVEADMSNYDDAGALAEAAVEEFGSLDVWVNNAGINIRGPAEEMAPEDWQRVLEVNLTGYFYDAQAAGRQMIEQDGGGSIVMISSMMGSMGQQDRTPYNTSKGGVNNLVRCLAVEWAEHDIHVNGLAPGYIHTEMVEGAMEDVNFTEEDIVRRTPLGRWGTTEEMANCVLFLAEANNFVTGEILTADGGWTSFAWGARD
jgi:3-oxoacyl-[acyl-carrier protein] reductase